MVSFSAPVTGGRVNTNSLGNSGKSIVLASFGVALGLAILAVGTMIWQTVGGLLPGSVGGGSGAIPVRRVSD